MLYCDSSCHTHWVSPWWPLGALGTGKSAILAWLALSHWGPEGFHGDLESTVFCLGLRLAVQTSLKSMVLFLFPLVGQLGWLQRGGGSALSRQVVPFQMAGELGPGAILLLLVISPQVP